MRRPDSDGSCCESRSFEHVVQIVVEGDLSLKRQLDALTDDSTCLFLKQFLVNVSACQPLQRFTSASEVEGFLNPDVAML